MTLTKGCKQATGRESLQFSTNKSPYLRNSAG